MGQLNALANSFEFEIVPITLSLGGLCISVEIELCIASGVDLEHQVCANETNTNCL